MLIITVSVIGWHRGTKEGTTMTISKFDINSNYGTYGYLLKDSDGSIVNTVKPKIEERRINGLVDDFWTIGWHVFDHNGDLVATFDFELGALLFLESIINLDNERQVGV